MNQEKAENVCTSADDTRTEVLRSRGKPNELYGSGAKPLKVNNSDIEMVSQAVNDGQSTLSPTKGFHNDSK